MLEAITYWMTHPDEFKDLQPERQNEPASQEIQDRYSMLRYPKSEGE